MKAADRDRGDRHAEKGAGDVLADTQSAAAGPDVLYRHFVRSMGRTRRGQQRRRNGLYMEYGIRTRLIPVLALSRARNRCRFALRTDLK